VIEIEEDKALRLEYPDISLAEFFLRTSADHPGYTATTLYGNDLSYAEIGRKAIAMAHAFREMGVRKGDRVALILPNSPTYVIAFFALMNIGAVAVNINVMAQADELARALVHAGAATAVTLDLFVHNLVQVLPRTPVRHIVLHSVFGLEKNLKKEGAFPPPMIFNELVASHPDSDVSLDASPDDVAVLQFTSGSTGAAKAVALSHRNIVSNIMQISAAMSTKAPDNAAVICIIPFFHVFGLSVCMLLSVYKGYRMVLVPQFDWSSMLTLLEMIDVYRPFSFPAVPALWASLVSHPEAARFPLKDIGVPSCGGAPLPSWVQEGYERLTGRKILEAYGLSEASSTTHMNPADRSLAGSIGIPLPDTRAKIVDIETGDRDVPPGQVGELVVAGPQVMKGYWNDPEMTRRALRNGWLYTGDLARMDGNGYFFLVDRKDDLIITSGYNVYPSDVESVLREHEKVRDAAVVGVPDALRGNVIKAILVTDEGERRIKADILAHCRRRLPPYKVPRIVEFREAIPRNPAGKTLRRPLRGN
jgi:long-chain acyl-CoA synthetase